MVKSAIQAQNTPQIKDVNVSAHNPHPSFLYSYPTPSPLMRGLIVLKFSTVSKLSLLGSREKSRESFTRKERRVRGARSLQRALINSLAPCGEAARSRAFSWLASPTILGELAGRLMILTNNTLTL